MSLGSGIRDPRSGIRNKPIPDPGSRGQKAPNPGSRIRIRNTGVKKIKFDNFLIDDFMDLLVVHLKLRISPRIFSKNSQ
jgi:hypothetical protein